MIAARWIVDWAEIGTQFKWVLEKLIVPLFVPFLVFLYAIIQLAEKRRVEFREKQLTEFYAPMLALRKRIESHIGFSDKLKEAHGGAWLNVVKTIGDDADPKKWDEAFEPYQRNLERSNEAWVVRLPLHQEMRKVFAEKYAYADHDVRDYFAMFDAFVEGLERYDDAKKNKSAALEALEKLVQPSTLEPFYKLVEQRVDEIQQQILRPWWWSFWPIGWR